MRFQQALHSRDKIVQIGDLRKYVVAEEQIRLLASCLELPSRFGSKEFHQRLDALLDSLWGNVRGGLNPQKRDAFLDGILKQGAVVTGHFDDEAGIIEREAGRPLIRVHPRVSQPRVGVRRKKVRVSENGVRTH